MFAFSYTETDPCMTGTLAITSTGFTLGSSRNNNNGTYALNTQNATITAPSCNLGGTLTYVKTSSGGSSNLTINLATNTFTVGSGGNLQTGTVTLTIPEPGTLALFMGGLGILLTRRRART